MFTGFSDETVDFMWGIRFNNERTWFEAHKDIYLRSFYQPMRELGDELYDFLAAKRPDLGLIRKEYRDYPNFRAAMADREERYNRQRSELFRLEREGRALVLAPESTAGFHRLERDLEKIRGMFQSGYDAAAARMDEIKAFLAGEDLP